MASRGQLIVQLAIEKERNKNNTKTIDHNYEQIQENEIRPNIIDIILPSEHASPVDNISLKDFQIISCGPGNLSDNDINGTLLQAPISEHPEGIELFDIIPSDTLQLEGLMNEGLQDSGAAPNQSDTLMLLCFNEDDNENLKQISLVNSPIQDITQAIDIELVGVNRSDLQLPHSSPNSSLYTSQEDPDVLVNSLSADKKEQSHSESEAHDIEGRDQQMTESAIEGHNNISNSNREVLSKKKRKKRGRANKEEWTQQKNKTKRLKGEQYCGRRRNQEGKIVFDVKKSERELKPRCLCTNKNKKSFKCYKVSDEERQLVFKNFWRLNWGERKIFVNSLIDKKSVAQRTVDSAEKSRRNISLVYHFKLKQSEDRIKVCKSMFLNTLSIGEWTVLNWVSDKTHNMTISQEKGNECKARKRQSKRQTEEQNQRDLVKGFLDSLPKLESHYCRRDTSKLYLEPRWQSKAELFRLYQSYCESQGKENLKSSICTFYSIFEERNLSIFQPKKDQCDICCSYKVGNLSEEEYNAHIKRKDDARKAKETDKNHSDDKTAVFTMDLEAVLLSPKLNASALYYRTKLKVHNFTIFNLKTTNVHCYLWDESEGGLNADEFASIISHFITKEVDRNMYSHLVFYSDGCTYQNRNSIMSNTLLLVSKETGLTITQKFLEKGHTQMECDSVHSRVESILRNREIYSPSGYLEACRTARINPTPYSVLYLHHDFFKKYSNLKFVSSIRPGVKKGDPMVTDLKCIEYKPDGSLKVKLNFSDNSYSDLPRNVIKPLHDVVIEQLYKSRLPIEASKFKHLQEMKSVLPRDIHPFYDTLPHYLSKSGRKICEGGKCSCIIALPIANSVV